MSEIIFNTLAETVKGHGETIHEQGTWLEEIKAKLDQQRDPVPELDAIKVTLTGLKENLQPVVHLESQVQQLSKSIRSHELALQLPLKKEVLHHFPKILWVAVGLFIVLSLCCSGWYMTYNRLENYQANDLKYRFLKMTGSEPLLHDLYRVDSLQRSPLLMKDSVELWEEETRQAVELQRSLERNSTDSKTKQQQLKNLESRKQGRSW